METSAAVTSRKVPIRNIFWNDAMDNYLLKGIHQLNCHLKPLKWRILMENFIKTYPQYDFMLESENEKKNLLRRLKARFVFMRDECQRILESGNRSALKTPELTEKFDLMKTIMDQTEKFNEEKRRSKERQGKLNAIEGEVLREDEDSPSDSDFESISYTGGVHMVPLAKDKKRSLITDTMVSLPYRFHN
jgi:hypothetical protein